MYWEIKQAIKDLWRSKSKTLLTSLGILIGVFSVVLLIALGQGVRSYIESQFAVLGKDLVYVYPGQILQGGQVAGPTGISGVKFKIKDAQRLSRINLVKRVVPVAVKRVYVKYQTEQALSDLYATNEQIFGLRQLQVAAGRLLQRSDISGRKKVVVIGYKLAQDLFGQPERAINKTVVVRSSRFRVIGVLQPVGGANLGGPDFDSYTYAPYSAVGSIMPTDEFFSLYVQLYPDTDVAQAKQLIRQQMLVDYQADDFSVVDEQELLSALDSIVQTLNLVLIAIAAVSLLVGGIGIMNIMYATVSERVKEIGIMRALGATRTDILRQFLVEASTLSLVGGVMGLLLAGLVVLLIRQWFPASINLTAVLVALGVSSAVGVFFGVLPAYQASRRPPIESIRYE